MKYRIQSSLPRIISELVYPYEMKSATTSSQGCDQFPPGSGRSTSSDFGEATVHMVFAAIA